MNHPFFLGYPNVRANEPKLKELIKCLNTAYDNKIIATGDSVLIFQDVIQKKMDSPCGRWNFFTETKMNFTISF